MDGVDKCCMVSQWESLLGYFLLLISLRLCSTYVHTRSCSIHLYRFHMDLCKVGSAWVKCFQFCVRVVSYSVKRWRLESGSSDSLYHVAAKKARCMSALKSDYGHGFDVCACERGIIDVRIMFLLLLCIMSHYCLLPPSLGLFLAQSL